MLRRPREAHDPCDQRVVPTVGSQIALREQFVETMGGSLTSALGYIETQRTQSGMFAARMRQMFPNACYIGFTGTPLLKTSRSCPIQSSSFRARTIAPRIATRIKTDVTSNGNR